MRRTNTRDSSNGRSAGRMVVLLLLGALVASQVAGEETEEQVLFKPGVFTSSEICGKCHQDIYKAWNEDSAHARSVTDPLFRGAVGRMRDDETHLCMMCHAPTTLVTEDYAGEMALTAEGITCDFCHSIKAVRLGSRLPFELDVGT